MMIIIDSCIGSMNGTGNRQLIPGQLIPGQLIPGQLIPGQLIPRQFISQKCIPKLYQFIFYSKYAICSPLPNKPYPINPIQCTSTLLAYHVTGIPFKLIIAHIKMFDSANRAACDKMTT